MMLDEKSAEFLATLYDRSEMTVAEANRLTGYDEGVSNPITGMLQRYQYIEYVYGESMMNTAGQWVDVNSSFRITPEGRAYVELTQIEGKNDTKPIDRQVENNDAKKIYRFNKCTLFWTAFGAIVAVVGIILSILMHRGIF